MAKEAKKKNVCSVGRIDRGRTGFTSYGCRGQRGPSAYRRFINTGIGWPGEVPLSPYVVLLCGFRSIDVGGILLFFSSSSSDRIFLHLSRLFRGRLSAFLVRVSPLVWCCSVHVIPCYSRSFAAWEKFCGPTKKRCCCVLDAREAVWSNVNKCYVLNVLKLPCYVRHGVLAFHLLWFSAVFVFAWPLKSAVCVLCALVLR